MDGDDIQALEDAILQVCPTHDRLKMFVVKRVHFSITPINDRDDVDVAIFKLIDEARKDAEKIKKLLTGLKGYRPVAELTDVQELCDNLLGKLQPMADPDKLLKPDLVSLFQQFDAEHDYPYVLIALDQAFWDMFDSSFRQMRPDRPDTSSLDKVQKILASYEPELAVRFVEAAIAKLRQSSQVDERAAFFQVLDDWRQRTAEEFNILSPPPEKNPRNPEGYLLMALEMPRPDVADIDVSAEFYLGEETFWGKPQVSRKRCHTFDEVVDSLAQWIQVATDELANEDCRLDCVELFLPGYLIETVMDMAEGWNVLDSLKHSVPFKYRNYVIRSLERTLHKPIQVCLEKNWNQLKCRGGNNAFTYFHSQMQCPQKGQLGELEAPGVGLFDLSVEAAERQGILYDVIVAGVPVVFWFGSSDYQTPEQRRTYLTKKLENTDVTHFVSLAKVWKDLRSEANVRLLVDHPERLHSLSEAENAPMVSETQSL